MKYCLALLLWGISTAVAAAPRNDIPSCYDYAHMAQYRPAETGRELVIIVDQTVTVPLDLKKSTWNQVLRFVQPGDHVMLYQFSALLQDNYMKRVFDGRLEMPFIDKKTRNGIGMDSLKSLDACLVQQQQFFAKTLGGHMAASFADSQTRIAKSEILDSLKHIASDLQHSPSSQTTILLISDMLENSDFDSFYRQQAIRELSPQNELQRVTRQGLLADFGGANVYVAGAGLIDINAKNSYRSGKVLRQLKTFWQDYFEASNAKLISFGTPELTVDLR
ncbi:hypothetical protein ACLECX_09500 [Lonsdalea quercina]|uniref:VWFA domain-containing protein n=1 Tax=Lonsdalea quercina TaxID=71657 RepID=A0A1H4F1B0_9GAMM|nr:hypothetical protein [Lonsdalea quercina]SEA90618.1 hypothetical protein SAMN02982996_02858 [Lonsdalea quercina]